MTSVSDCDPLREPWDRLLSQCEDVTPFETFEWTKANLISFENNGVQVLAFRDHSSRIVGIVPLVLRRGRKFLRRRRWLEFAGLPYADYGICLVCSGFESQVAGALVDYLRSVRPTWNGVYLDNIRQNDEFTRNVPAAAREVGLFAIMQPTFRIRRLTKAAFTADPHSGLQASKTLAKARRKISEAGEVTFDVKKTEVDIREHLESYFKMHIERCSSKGVISPLAEAGQQRFFQNIVKTCAASGQVWLSILSCGGRPIAYRFSLCYRGSLHLYSTCFAPLLAKYSPSMLLLESLLDYAFGHGIQVVDFGMGASPQKEKAGAIAEQRMARVELYHSRHAYAEGQLYLAVQRNAAKSKLLRNGSRMLRKLLPYRQQ